MEILTFWLCLVYLSPVFNPNIMSDIPRNPEVPEEANAAHSILANNNLYSRDGLAPFAGT